VNDPKQLLGIKGASETSSIWKLRIQLMKPITWIPLIWGVICGAAASGNFEWTFSNVLASLACMLMSGPLLAGYTQTINDFFDKEIDAINEPNRPIPSGKISIKDVKIQIWVLLIAGLIVAFLLDLYAKHNFPSVLLLALGGSTYKLPFGHRGLNHPCGENNKIEITSQNHGFAIDPNSLSKEIVRITHFNLNDNTVAGLEVNNKPIFSVQYHPEAGPGPHDSDYLFTKFVSLMLERC